MRRPDRVGHCGHEDGVLDRSTPATVAYVDHDDTRLPLGGIGDSIVHPDVVDAAVGVVVFADELGFVRVAHVDDHVLVASREREEVVVRGEHVVDPTGHPVRVERRRNDRMGRVGHVEDHDPVPAIGRALSGERSVAAVR